MTLTHAPSRKDPDCLVEVRAQQGLELLDRAPAHI
jgi:hypothetical protein